MKNKATIIKLVIAIILVLGISVMQHTPSAVADIQPQTEPTNRIVIDVTYDPGTQTFSLGGFSAEELRQFGVAGFTPELWQILANFDKIDLRLEGEELNLITDEEQVASMAWDANSRQLLFAIVNAYMEIGKVDMERAEAWLSDSNLEISLRNTKELSDPLLIDLATLLQVKVYDSGAVRVEGVPTGYSLTPELLATFKALNVDSVKLCWNKGVLNTELNVGEFPQFTFFENGIGVIDKALGLNLGDLGPIFDSSFGAGIVIGEGDPITGECLP